jgi:acylphosphatase
MAKTRAHVYVNGLVQGVFFRQNTKRQAQSKNVQGWVQNLPDGRVEAVFEGDEPAVKALVDYCCQGPPHAKVEKIEVNYEPYKGEFSSFEAC